MERYDELGYRGFMFLFLWIMAILKRVFTIFICIIIFPFVIVGWIRERYFEN